MYEQFYGLRERPFDLEPDPRFLFLSAKHREALSTLEHGIEERNGIVVLTGGAGTGKTTLIKAILGSIQPARDRSVYIANPTLNRSEFFELLTVGFGLSSLAASSKTAWFLELELGSLARRHGRGVTALIIDEAQSLRDELLEEVRLLSNIGSAGGQLLSVALAGQPGLDRRLEESGLQRRLGPRCRIGALDTRETAAYIASRVRVAGGEAAGIFSRQAVVAIFEHSQGIPRAINVICDNALREGLVTNTKPVTQKTVLDTCQRLDLAGEQPATRPRVVPPQVATPVRIPTPTVLVRSPRILIPLWEAAPPPSVSGSSAASPVPPELAASPPTATPPEAAAKVPPVAPPPPLDDNEEAPLLLEDTPPPFSWRRLFRRRRDESQS
jgi:general secretion pathway protein A